MPSNLSVNTSKELASLLEGRSDQEINEVVKSLGTDAALEKVFEGMTKAFLADKAKGESAVIHWDIKGPDGQVTYQVKVADGHCSAAKGTPDAARVTLSASLPDFLRIITGKLNGTMAFFTGKLKLSGDVMFAATQERWFDKNFGG